jgi:hypothetical protein
LATLSERLTKRFRNVPGVTSTDVVDWIAEAEAESGLTADDLENDQNNALLYLSFSIGCRIIATDAARFFKYTDGEESVDKANIYENYLRLSLEAFRQYRYYLDGGGSRTTAPKRADGR